MKQRSQGPQLAGLLAIGISLGLGAAATVLAESPAPVPAGEQPAGDLDATLKDLQARIAAALPRLSEPKIAAFQAAREAVMKAKADAAAALAPFDKIEAAEGLVGHRKGKWIGGAENGIAGAEAALKKAMLEAGGVKDGKYGPAMQVYDSIQKASPRAKEGLFHRLAIATSVEHAEPVKQVNPVAATNAPAFVDPVKRYLHFEKAYLGGELDPAFKGQSAWELSNVVNGNEPDETLVWGREMLRNYRPDHIFNTDYGWRYSGAVTTDVKYGSENVQYDRPELQDYQNIIMNGGICGRRAFFGRFILRSFGNPTVARPQVGHGALARWTPDGWIVNLGAGWGSRESNGVMQMTDADFVLETQVRKNPAGHEQALRAQWVGDALGEAKYVSMEPGSGGLWNLLSQFQKKLVVADTKSVTLAARGTELGEANLSAETMATALVKAEVSQDDIKIATSPDGVITIPAAACEGGNQLIKSFLGGQQMICAKPFQLDVSVPQSAKYQLSARVVTVRDNPPLLLTLNEAAEGIEIPIPYSLGAWQQTPPVTIELKSGANTLAFTHQTRAFALKDLTLTPVK